MYYMLQVTAARLAICNSSASKPRVHLDLHDFRLDWNIQIPNHISIQFTISALRVDMEPAASNRMK